MELTNEQGIRHTRHATGGSSNGLNKASLGAMPMSLHKTCMNEAAVIFVKPLSTGLLCRQKRGLAVGKTKRGKGTKVMAIADAGGVPVAAHVESASPHEIKLVEATIDSGYTQYAPDRLIGDKAYDSDQLDQQLSDERSIELIVPHKRNRKKLRSQDGRKLRRYRRRWKVERLFAWIQSQASSKAGGLTN